MKLPVGPNVLLIVFQRWRNCFWGRFRFWGDWVGTRGSGRDIGRDGGSSRDRDSGWGKWESGLVGGGDSGEMGLEGGRVGGGRDGMGEDKGEGRSVLIKCDLEVMLPRGWRGREEG